MMLLMKLDGVHFGELESHPFKYVVVFWSDNKYSILHDKAEYVQFDGVAAKANAPSKIAKNFKLHVIFYHHSK